ncbi:MAG: hypothetical protein WBB45_02075 [Cyclobacteriaceae bacterium]
MKRAIAVLLLFFACTAATDQNNAEYIGRQMKLMGGWELISPDISHRADLVDYMYA